MAEEDEADWDVYCVYDGAGNAHVVRRPTGRSPQVRCIGCDE